MFMHGIAWQRWKSVLAVLLALGVLAAAQASLGPAQAAEDKDKKRRPLTVEQLEDLSFGRLINNALTPGEAVVEAASGRKVVRGGMVHLSGDHGSAEFLITGEPGARFVVILPQELPLRGEGGAKVVLTNFTSEPSETGILGPGGRATVFLGATLKVLAGQPVGRYRADLDIFVDYLE